MIPIEAEEVYHDFKFLEVYRDVFTTKARYIDIMGGRAAGRSHFATDYFLFKIIQDEPFRGCFLRNVFNDIRSSLFQDFKDRLAESSLDENDFKINDSSMTVLHVPTGNTIISKGFKKSAGNRSAKLKSLAGLTHVLIEEADENNESDVNMLDDSIRTNKIEDIQIIFLHNPPHKDHWICKRFYNLLKAGVVDKVTGKPAPYYIALPKSSPDVLMISSNYLDNIDNLNEKTVKRYEEYGDPESQWYNPEHYYTNVKGLIAEGVKGRIYTDDQPITAAFYKSLPYEEYFGLDFGYSDDPVALIGIKSHNKRNFYREYVYEAGLTNPALAVRMRALGITKRDKIYADSAEPKSIQELKDLGFLVIAADKGPDSVNFGIKQIKSEENYYTEDSANYIKEDQNYKWDEDADGNPIAKPVDKFNHLQDAKRYARMTHKSKRRAKNVKVAQTGSAVSDGSGGIKYKKNPLDWLDSQVKK